MAVRHDKKLAFIHIPKTAGVAVQKNFKMDGNGDHQAYTYYKQKYPAYLTFAIVRNPFDRLVSAYEFMKVHDQNPEMRRYQKYYKNGFDDFCRNIYKYNNGEWMSLIFMPQHEFICDDKGNLMIDKLYHFEENFWVKLYNLFGEVVKVKKYNATIRAPWEQYYDEYTKNLIFEYYKVDFELFGYYY